MTSTPTKRRVDEVAKVSPPKRRQEDPRVANMLRLVHCPYASMLRTSEGGILQYRADETQRWKSLSGIIEAARQTFYPQYDYRKASNAAVRRKWSPNKTPAPPVQSFVDFKARVGCDGGREFGEYLDDEYAQLVERWIAESVPFVPRSFRRLPPTTSPHLRALLDFHYTNRWQPLFTQYRVFAPGLGVGTRIDEICIDAEGNLIVVELKYGYDQYREFGNACMNAPLDDVLDSPQHQHMLQCGLPALMLQRHWKVKVGGAFVVYVTDGEVYPLPVAAWFWERQDAIWDAFEQQMKKRV